MSKIADSVDPQSQPERLPCPRCGSTRTTTIRIIGLETEGSYTVLKRTKKCRDCCHRFGSAEMHDPLEETP